MAENFVSLVASKFGLSEDEARVYSLFVLYKILTLGEICYYTALSASKVKSILQTLRDKGLISQVPGVVERYTAVTPFKTLSEVASNFMKMTEETETKLRKHFEFAKADIERSVNSFKSELKESMLSELQALRGEVNRVSKLLRKLTQRERADLSDMVGKMESYSLGQVENYRKLSEESLTKVKGAIEEGMKSVLHETKEVFEQNTEKVSNTLASMLDGANTILGEIEKKVIKDASRMAEATTLMTSNIAERIMNVKSEYDSKAREAVEAANYGTSKAISLLRNELDEHAGSMMKIVSGAFRKSIEKKREQTEKLEKILSASAKRSTSEIAKNISSFYTSVLKPLWSLSREHEREIQTVSERTSKLVDASISRLSSLIEDVKARIAERIKKHLEIQEEVLEGFGSEVKEHVTSNLKDFETISSSIRERFSSVITENAKATSEVFEKTRSTFESLISEHADTVRNILKRVEEKVQASLVSEKGAEKKEFSKFREAFSSMLEVSKRELTETARLMTENALKEIHIQTAEFINELRRLRGKLSETIEKELNTVRWEAENVRKNIDKFLAQRITSMEEYTNQVKLQLEEIIKERLEEVGISVETIQVGFIEAMDRILERLKEVVEGAKRDFSSSLANQLSLFKESLEKISISFSDELSRQVDATKAEANEILLRFSEELKLKVSEIEAMSNQIMENAEATFKKQEKISRQLRDVASVLLVQEAKRQIDSFSNFVSSLNERLLSLIEARIESLEKLRNNLEKELHSIIFSEGSVIEERNASLRDMIRSHVSEKYKEYAKSSELVVKEVETLLCEHMEKYKEHIEGIVASLSQTLDETLEKLSQISDTITDSVADQLDMEKEAITGEAKILTENANKILEHYIKNLRSGIAASLSKLLNEISGQIESLREEEKRVETLVKDVAETEFKEFEEELRNLEDTLVSNVNNEKERVLSSVIQLESKLQELLNKVKEEFTAYSSSIKEESTGVLDQYLKEVISILEATSREVSKHLEESRKTFGVKTNEAKSAINKLMEELIKELNEIMRRTHEGITTLVIRHHEEIERNVQETKERLMSEFKTHIEKEEKDVTSFSQNVVKALSLLIESCGKTLEGLNNKIISYLTEFYENYAEYLRSTMESISENIRVLLEELKSVDSISRLAWENLAKEPLIMEKTFFIATKELVKTRMKEMAAQTKNSLIIVVPELEELPIEELLKIEPPARVYVFTDFNLPSEINTLKSLIGKRNLRLWRREEKEFFMCLRDNEEILIAPISEEEPILAIVSEDQSYINAYKHTLIPLLRSTSREVKAKDIEFA